ncbi:transposase [Vibrio parahaemolyticus]|uniref:transposase n=1 Tax=Vibrio parahaemolyticus TaxID=670 RepID=UPI003F64BFBD
MSQYIKDKANDFKTVSVIKLPPYSPELNSIEQVWSGLRQRYLANQSFTDYDNIISKVCDAWNRFLDCSKRVTKMCSRRWIDLTS